MVSEELEAPLEQLQALQEELQQLLAKAAGLPSEKPAVLADQLEALRQVERLNAQLTAIENSLQWVHAMVTELQSRADEEPEPRPISRASRVSRPPTRVGLGQDELGQMVLASQSGLDENMSKLQQTVESNNDEVAVVHQKLCAVQKQVLGLADSVQILMNAEELEEIRHKMQTTFKEKVGRAELQVMMERMHEELAKLAESNGGINDEVDAVFSSLGDSVAGLKSTLRRELASLYTRLENQAEQHSIPKVEVPLLLVSALSPMSGGNPQGYSVTMTSAKVPSPMVGGMGRTLALNEVVKTSGEAGMVACPKMLDNWLQSPERPKSKIKMHTAPSKGYMSAKYPNQGTPNICSKVKLAPVSKSPIRRPSNGN